VAHLAVSADAESFARPGAAPGRARLQVVMAGKAQDLQVLLAVVAALQHSESVMHLQHTLGA
jgi:hypothetical protein